MGDWFRRARFPEPTLAVLAVFAAIFWLNAAINPYRFWVALAVIASVPVAFVLVRGAQRAAAARAGASSSS